MTILKMPLSNIPGERNYGASTDAINIPLETVLAILDSYDEEIHVWDKYIYYLRYDTYYFINTNSDGYRALAVANQLSGSPYNLTKYGEIFSRVCITEADCLYITEPKQGEYVDYYVTVKGIRKYSVPF